MRTLQSFLGFILLATVAAAQTPTVVSIQPSAGPISGGTEVTIVLSAIPNCPILPPDPTIAFGGAAAQIVSYPSNNSIIVRTPAHTAGPVSVSFSFCGADPFTSEDAFIFFDPSTDPDPSRFEKVLFPIVFEGPGARGSQWRTSILVYNSGAETVDAARQIFEANNSACPLVCGCVAGTEVPPGESRSVCVAGFHDPMGLIYYPEKEGVKHLHFGSRVFDISRSSENAGTEIPVVREGDFRTDVIELVNVPSDDAYRVALRIFDPDQQDGAPVRVKIFPMSDGSGGPLVDTAIALSYPIRTLVYDPFPTRPAFAFVGDLAAEYPALRNAGLLRIELTPESDGLRIWAFASATNNETQLVTVVSPQ